MKHVPNALSILRVILAAPAVLLVRSESAYAEFWLAVVIGAAVLTDALDGALARARRLQSDVGRVLDPLADKLFLGATAVALAVWRDFPLWLLAPVVVRDAAILVVGAALSRRTRSVPESALVGKLYASALFVAVAAFAVKWEAMKNVAVVAVCALWIASTVAYARRAASLWRISP